MAESLPDSADVVVIGAGMAGLAAAIEVRRSGLSCVVLEAADAPGGRVRTDLVDGFRLDRGFQLLNPAYPQLQRLHRLGVLDLARLQLQPFDAGVRIALDGRHAVLADPWRSPRDAPAAIRAILGAQGLAAAGRDEHRQGTALLRSLREASRFAAFAARCGTARANRLIAGGDEPYGAMLDRLGITGALRTGVLDPFLAGVLGEDRGITSSRFVRLLVRAFVRGTPAVPAWGMQALSDQLAEATGAGTVRLGLRADSVEGTGVHTAAGWIGAGAVLVAADPRTAAALLDVPAPAMNALTTFWFAAAEAPCSRPILHVDGLRRGPVVNAAVLSAAAPAYSPDGRALIACSIVGADDSPGMTATVRRQAGQLFGTDTSSWQLLRADAIADALPTMAAPLDIRKPVRLGERLFVAGDHRDTASLQGALASGTRAARELVAVLAGR